ncbi:hypothetical protein OHA_3_00018 (plasmid) [Pleomorphomonas sp. SM30]|nr:hypothetical protein OHA_3_00018 [Pleomorphomonas sp. SM30]
MSFSQGSGHLLAARGDADNYDFRSFVDVVEGRVGDLDPAPPMSGRRHVKGPRGADFVLEGRRRKSTKEGKEMMLVHGIPKV